MPKLSAIMKLTRIEHSLMLIIAVVAAEIIASGLPQLSTLVLSIITAVFVSMGAFAINDYFDVEVDRENKKKRPLVTGDLSMNEALMVTLICISIGIIASVFINIYCLSIALSFGMLSLLYSYKLKEMPLIGNAYVALSMSIPFLFGNYVVSQTIGNAVLYVFLLVFIAGLAREIHGTVRDFKGDAKRKAVTVPSVIGIRASAWLGFALYMIAIGISAYLFLQVKPFMANAVYAILIAIADIMLLYSGIVFAMGDTRKYNAVRNISLAGMAVALICILASAVLYVMV